MNNITIAGNLSRDAEIKYLPNGDPAASFAVADNQGKDKPAIFWNCQIYGKRAESLSPYLTKGQAVTITGSMREREYTDKSGVKQTFREVRVNDLALQGGKREQQAAPKQNESDYNPPASKNLPHFDEIDSDIPF